MNSKIKNVQSKSPLSGLLGLSLLALVSCGPSQSNKDLCKYSGCTNEVTGWENYQTDGSYSGPMGQGSFRIKEYGGSFCSQDHAIKALD